jgi:hypothetical protein
MKTTKKTTPKRSAEKEQQDVVRAFGMTNPRWARITRNVRTKLGVAFMVGDEVTVYDSGIIECGPLAGEKGYSAWSVRNGIMTAIRPTHFVTNVQAFDRYVAPKMKEPAEPDNRKAFYAKPVHAPTVKMKTPKGMIRINYVDGYYKFVWRSSKEGKHQIERLRDAHSPESLGLVEKVLKNWKPARPKCIKCGKPSPTPYCVACVKARRA